MNVHYVADSVHPLPTDSQLLTHKEVLQRLSLTHNTLRRLEKAGKFPARLALGVRCVRWRSADVDSWVKDPEGWMEKNNRGRGYGGVDLLPQGVQGV